jgi:hypothetical protein
VDVSGVATLRAAIADMARDLDDFSDVNARAARIIASAARANAPRDTGALAASLTPTSDRHRAGVASSLPYAGIVEFGWARHPAEPYARPGAHSTERTWLRLYEDELDDLCTDVARKAPSPCPPGRR